MTNLTETKETQVNKIFRVIEKNIEAGKTERTILNILSKAFKDFSLVELKRLYDFYLEKNKPDITFEIELDKKKAFKIIENINDNNVNLNKSQISLLKNLYENQEYYLMTEYYNIFIKKLLPVPQKTLNSRASKTKFRIKNRINENKYALEYKKLLKQKGFKEVEFRLNNWLLFKPSELSHNQFVDLLLSRFLENKETIIYSDYRFANKSIDKKKIRFTSQVWHKLKPFELTHVQFAQTLLDNFFKS